MLYTYICYMVFEREPKKFYEYFIKDKACPIRLETYSEDGGRRLLRKVGPSLCPRRLVCSKAPLFDRRGHCWMPDEMALNRFGCSFSYRRRDRGCFLFPFSEEQRLPSSIPSPTSQRRALVGVKSGVWLASCPLTSQTVGEMQCSLHPDNYDRRGIPWLWNCGLPEAGLLCPLFVKESRFCCLVESVVS